MFSHAVVQVGPLVSVSMQSGCYKTSVLYNTDMFAYTVALFQMKDGLHAST